MLEQVSSTREVQTFAYARMRVLSCVFNHMDCSPPGSSVHVIFQAKRLPFPPPGDLPDPRVGPISPASGALAGRFFTTKPSGKP